MAARTSIARLGRLATSTPVTCTHFRAQNVLQRFQPSSRSFAASAMAQVKKYTKDHEWVELDAAGKTVTLGISTYAANALGDVIYVELPESDLEVASEDAVGAVESVKSASDILTPVAGKIVESNNILEEKPSLLNSDPEGEGWITKIEIGAEAKAEIEGLMDEGAYKAFTEESSE